MDRLFKGLYFFRVLYVTLMAGVGCTPQASYEETWLILFDGTNIDKWDTYLGPCIGEGISWENIGDQPPVGLNNDTLGVFQIVSLEGEKVLRVSGACWGGIFTKQSFENFHLQLQFKWGNRKWYPRDNPADKRDSGLLYYGVDKHGENDLFWLKSQEFQIQEGDCGDFWGVGGTIIDIHAEPSSDSTYRYNATAPMLSFSETGNHGRHCQKHPDAENPSGSWNTIDLYCYGGTSVHLVNDLVTMVLENSRHLVNGAEVPLTKGKIELQSESAEVFYRKIRIRPIDSIPAKF